MPGDLLYCVDSSTLIHLRRTYPEEHFPTLWERLSGLVRARRLIAPGSVRREVERGSDALVAWAKKHRKMFRRPGARELEIVAEVLPRFPGLVDPGSETEVADPFVVALAVALNERKAPTLFGEGEECVVVTQERGRPGVPRIPEVCEAYGIRALRHLDLFRAEGWRF